MKNIKYISEPFLDNPQKYGKYAKEKVQVIYKESQEEYYLDEKKAYDAIVSYHKDLKDEISAIKEKTFGMRVKYNAIMTAIAAGIFFAGIGLGNLLTLMKLNPIIIQIVFFTVALVPNVYGFIHINEKKFYYTDKEQIQLKKNQQEIEKCSHLEQIIDGFDKNELLEIDLKRTQIDNKYLRYHNYERNQYLQNESDRNLMEARDRIEMEVQKKLREQKENLSSFNHSKSQLSLKKDLDKLEKKSKLTREKISKKVYNWLVESFQDDGSYIPYTPKEGNYVMRGEKRRK